MADVTSYEILVQETLDGKWTSFFLPFSLSSTGNGTLLSGQVHDQAELFGIVLKIRDMGLRLVSVNPVHEH